MENFLPYNHPFLARTRCCQDRRAPPVGASTHLDPEFPTFLHGLVSNTPTVGGRNDDPVIFRVCRRTGIWPQLPVEEFVERFVAVYVWDEEFIQGNRVFFDEARLSFRQL